ncbi:MAG: hypothetical protein V4701_10565, partial [Pseudomonadota bacterium]
EASTWMRVYDSLADRARSEVMADLPDIKPPLLESRREPLKLVAAESSPINNINAVVEATGSEAQMLDSLDSVFSECNTAA